MGHDHRRRRRSRARTRSRCPVLASTLTTMAVLLPVLLLAGLAKKLFAPLALTVAVAMIASYFVSMAVTPVACRYFLGHAEHGRFGRRVERRHRPHRRRLRRARCAACCRIAAAIVARRPCAGRRQRLGWAARLPSTFFPEIDESMDARLRALRARHLARRTRPKQIDEMGRDARRRELPKGTVELVLDQHRHAAERAQRDRQPERRPAHGLHPPRVSSIPRSASSRRARSPTRPARSSPTTSRASSSCSGRAASSPASSPTATSRRSSSRSAATTSTQLDDAGQGGRRGRAHRPGRARRLAIAPDRLPRDPRRHRSRRRRAWSASPRATRRRRRSRPRSATSTRRASGSTRTTGSRYYVVTYYDDAQVADTQRARAAPGARRRRTASRSRSAPTATSAAPSARSRSSATTSQRVAHVLMQTEGRDIGSAADELETALKPDPRTRDIDFDFVGQVELMRTTFSGLGLALGARGDGRLHDHGVAVQVAAPAVRHALHDPGLARRHRAGAHGGGAGLLDHGAHGHPDGHRHRRLERHPARRRREPALPGRHSAPARRSSRAPARASCRSR